MKNECEVTNWKIEDQKKCTRKRTDWGRALEAAANERKPVGLQFRE